MKKTVIKIAIAIAVVLALSCLSGCSKLKKELFTTAYYKYFGLEEMYYIIAEESTAVKFFSELGSVLEKYDGTDFTESQLVNDVDKVARKYNYGVVEGTFYLKKSSDEDGPWTNVKSWDMTFNSKYNTRAAVDEIRPCTDIVK